MPSHRTGTRPAVPAAVNVEVNRQPAAIAAVLEDAAHYPGGYAAGVARPRSEAEVVALTRQANRLLPIGAQSSLTGGATPMGEVVLSTDRLDRVIDIGTDEVTLQPGVPLAVLKERLAGQGLFYPPVPTFDGAFAGGVVATNAAGATTFKYGSTRDWVRRLTVVLADGDVLDLVRGEVLAHPDGYFEIHTAGGLRRVPVPRYRMPDVPKCSAGYFARPEMDLVDLFVGSEGTLGIITEITFAVQPRPPKSCLVWLPLPHEAEAIALVGTLRAAAQTTWRMRDPHGIDVAAIEQLDRRSLELVRKDGANQRYGVSVPDDAEMALLVQMDLPSDTTLGSDEAYAQISEASNSGAPDTPLVRLCRLFAQVGVLERAEIALPAELHRQAQLFALREAVPEAVNRRVGEAKRAVDSAIEKTAADMIVPFPRLAESLEIFREAFDRRGLDYAIWGHISDGNVHPNVIPRTLGEVRRGWESILDCGHKIVSLGGCPLAEHGVGRNWVKQELLRQLYGKEGITDMRCVKAALDPEGKLAPGVLFPS